MRPAEFKTIRENLGLTSAWVADQAGVSMRKVKYAEAGAEGRTRISDDLVAFIERLESEADAWIRDMAEKLEGLPAVALVRFADDQELWRFCPEMEPLPAVAYAARLYRLRQLLLANGQRVTIDYLDQAEFQAWLGDRRNSRAARQEWLAEKQVTKG